MRVDFDGEWDFGLTLHRHQINFVFIILVLHGKRARFSKMG